MGRDTRASKKSTYDGAVESVWSLSVSRAPLTPTHVHTRVQSFVCLFLSLRFSFGTCRCAIGSSCDWQKALSSHVDFVPCRLSRSLAQVLLSACRFFSLCLVLSLSVCLSLTHSLSLTLSLSHSLISLLSLSFSALNGSSLCFFSKSPVVPGQESKFPYFEILEILLLVVSDEIRRVSPGENLVMGILWIDKSLKFL